MERISYWLDSSGQPSFPPVTDSATEVVVVGGGITGLMTAYILAGEGVPVLLLEKDRIGWGTTGFSSAKVTVQHGMVHQRLQRQHGHDVARAYSEAQQAGFWMIAAVASEEDIDCDMRWIPSALYTEDAERRDDLAHEAEICQALGLPAQLVGVIDLPFPVAAALELPNQLSIHPYRFCQGLARSIVENGGRIAEGTLVRDVTGEDPIEVVTDRGHIKASAVVLATQTPIVNSGAFFARTAPSMSYVIAGPYEDLPEVMALSIDEPMRSIRPHRGRDATVLLIGGSGHRTGRPNDEDPYRELESWAKQRFEGFQPRWRWGAQDFMPADGLPFIGPMTHRRPNIYVATGFAKWGLSTGAAAGRLISNRILGKHTPWGDIFDPTRVRPLASAPTVLHQGVETVRSIIGDRLLGDPEEGTVGDLAPGCGAIVKVHGERVAAFRDEDGSVRAVSPICTHLGCLIEFNGADRTWDCPCHGSRFDTDGRVVSGPATRDLDRIQLEVVSSKDDGRSDPGP